jgi:hypothetical protein
MSVPIAKVGIARLVVLLLKRGREYGALELDALTKNAIRADLLADPRLAPDHIRFQMVESKFVEYEPLRNLYRVHPDFVLPDEFERTYERLQQYAYHAKPSDRKECPICGHNYGTRVLPGHFLRDHQLSELDQLMKKYG